MRKFTKALAAVLLVAVVVSVMAVLPTFTASAAEAAAALTPTTTLDLDTISNTTISVANQQNVAHDNNTPDDTSDDYSGPGLTMTKKTDENGQVYWLLQSHALAGQQHGSGAYLNYANGTAGLNPSYSFGSAGTSTKQAVDFFVFDMDVSTDTEFFSKLNFHSRFKGTGGTVQNGEYYPAILGDDADNLYVDTNISTNVSYPTIPSNDEWVNITFVYDFRGDDYTAWKMYAYIDGYFVGSFGATSSKSTNIAYESTFIRPSVPNVAGSDFESIKIRNWTYTNFPKGWEGDLTAINTRGSYAVPLSEIDELAYCLEGTNAAKAPIASVQHADGTTDVFNTFEELNASFLDGDVVTLNRNVGTPILVNASGVTFVDNGYDYKLVDTSEVDFSTAAFVVQSRKDRSVIASGDAAAFTTYFETNGLTDGYMVTLFEDLTWSLTDKYAYARQFIFELNGNKLTLAAAGRHFDTSGSSEGVLRFQNGSLSYAGTGSDLTMLAANNAIIFDNLDFSIDVNGNVLDQRHGLIRFKDCNIAVNQDTAISSTKSHGGRWAAFEVIDSTVTKESGADPFLTCANYATSSKRQGGANIRIDLAGSEINWPQNIIYFEAYANQEALSIADDGTVTCSSSYLAANAFDLDFNFTDSTINSTEGYYAVRFVLKTLKTTTRIKEVNDFDGDGVTGETITVPAENAYVADGLSIDLDINVNNSTLRTYDLVRAENASGYTSATVPHTFDMDIVVDGESYVKADAGLVYYNLSKVDEAYTCDVVLGEGTKLTSPLIDRTGNKQKVTSTTLGDGTAKIVHTGLYDGFGYIVTSSYDTYTYQLGEKTPVEFYWNLPAEGADAVDINKVVTIADDVAGVYKYSWAQDGKAFRTVLEKDFTVHSKSNLTLFDSFYYNLFIQADEYDAYKTYIQVLDANGNAIEPDAELANIDGVDYYKFQAKSAPEASASDAIKVVMTVEGVYSDKYTDEVALSVLSYSKNILENSSDDESIALIKAVLNYMAAAMTYEGIDATEVEELIEGEEFAAPGSETIEGSVPGLELSVRYESEISWLLNATEDVTFEVTYTAGGTEMSYSKSLKAGETFEIKTKAYDLVNGLTVKSGDNTAVVTIAGYYNAVSEADAKLLIAAIYNYALAADAYKN